MNNRVVMVLVDGMRPDGMVTCGNPYVETFRKEAACDLKGRTVFPSVTLPCHMSLFHSVDPQRHGITTNIYTPMVRPIDGLFEQLDKFDKKCAFFNTWEELRDLSRPDHLWHYEFENQHKQKDTDTRITDRAIAYIRAQRPDFTFVYLGETDEVGGHDSGWMSETYLSCVHKAWDCIYRIADVLTEEDTLIVLADHGGHDRVHGTEMDEDMTIPICFRGRGFAAGTTLTDCCIKDVAPTVCALLSVPAAKGWEGKALPDV